MSAIDDMDDALLLYDVHAAFALNRRKLAATLVSEAVTPDDVALIADQITRSTDAQANRPAIILAVLADPAARADRITQLRRQAELRAAAKAEPRFGDKPAAIAPLPGEDAKKWAYDRNCRIAYCRVVADRRSAAEVATELGVPAADLPAMIERGLALQEPSVTPKSGKVCRKLQHDDAEHAARVKRFVEAYKRNRRKNELRATENQR